MKLMKIPEVAKRLNVSSRTVYNLIRTGELKTIRISTQVVRIRHSDLEAYITSCERAPGNENT